MESVFPIDSRVPGTHSPMEKGAAKWQRPQRAQKKVPAESPHPPWRSRQSTSLRFTFHKAKYTFHKAKSHLKTLVKTTEIAAPYIYIYSRCRKAFPGFGCLMSCFSSFSASKHMGFIPQSQPGSRGGTLREVRPEIRDVCKHTPETMAVCFGDRNICDWQWGHN